MKKTRLLLLVVVATMFLASCTAGPNTFVDTVTSSGDVAGFWNGLWHGVISPFTFIITLFTDDVSLYEVHNNGNWYDFGFALGAGILFSSSYTQASSKR